MSDLAEFLLARIAEDEAAAGDANVDNARWWVDGPGERSGHWWIYGTGQKFADRATAEHIARHDPARVLAECDAKRRTVTRATRAAALVGKHPSANLAHDVLQGVLLDMALPYGDHAAYREEWRP